MYALHHTLHIMLCSADYCDPQCINGKCTGAQTCTCNPGWIGDQCDQGEPAGQMRQQSTYNYNYIIIILTNYMYIIYLLLYILSFIYIYIYLSIYLHIYIIYYTHKSPYI